MQPNGLWQAIAVGSTGPEIVAVRSFNPPRGDPFDIPMTRQEVEAWSQTSLLLIGGVQRYDLRARFESDESSGSGVLVRP